LELKNSPTSALKNSDRSPTEKIKDNRVKIFLDGQPLQKSLSEIDHIIAEEGVSNILSRRKKLPLQENKGNELFSIDSRNIVPIERKQSLERRAPSISTSSDLIYQQTADIEDSSMSMYVISPRQNRSSSIVRLGAKNFTENRPNFFRLNSFDIA
jgi:hypothetical protein